MPAMLPPRLPKTALLLFPVLLLAVMLGWLAGLDDSPATVAQQTAAPQSGGAAPPALERAAPETAGAVEMEDVFAKFDAWAAAYTGGESAEGVALARERRAALRSLIESDPQEALGRALPWTLRRRMPAGVAALLEERVSATGEYSVMAGTPMPGSGGRPFIQRSFTAGSRSYDVYVYGRREHVGTKYDFPADGIAVDEALALRERPVRSPEPDEPQLPGEVVRVAQDGHEVAEASGIPLVSGGNSYRVCCMAHAGALEQGLVDGEESAGPWMDPDVAPSVWTEGAKKALVIRVDFSDEPGTPRNTNNQEVTTSFVTTEMNGVVADYMSEVSYRKSSISTATADVTPVLRMPRTAAFYATGNAANTLRVDALAAATTAGYNVNSYDRQLVAFRNIGPGRISGSGFSWAGLGQLGGPFTWYNGYFQDLVIVHELGHNLGLPHASLWRSTDGNPVSLSGSVQAYGDPFDCMGNNFGGPVPRMWFNPWFLNRIDWLPNGAVETVTAPGIYRVFRYDHPDAPLNRRLALRVQKDGTRNYWLCYRRQFAGVAGGLADISAGAQVIWGFNTNRESNLIDCDTPASNAQDASLNVGSSLTDEDAGISFTVKGSGGSGVDQYIDIEVIQTGRIYPLQSQYDVDEAAGSVTVWLARAGEPNQGATVTVSTQNGTAVAPNDYTAVSTTVTWSGTDTAPKPVQITIQADSFKESAESFFVNFAPNPGSGPDVVVSGSPVTVTIREPGMADTTFAHGSFDQPRSVRSMVVQPEGRIVFTGESADLDDDDLDGLGRLESDGKLDASFNQGSGMTPAAGRVVARQADGKLIFGGGFTALRDEPARRLARLYADGFTDDSFDVGTGPNGEVRALDVMADGRILAVGAFTQFAGSARRGLARLHSDGSLDTSFLAVPLPNFTVMEVDALLLQPDGKVIVAGLIRTQSAGQLFNGLSSGVLRLNSDGTVDTSFDIGEGAHLEGDADTPARVHALALQSDGKVLVGGAFTGFRGVTARRIARLNSDGTLDSGFQAAMGASGPNGTVRSLAIQPDGRILLAGEFSQVAGATRNQLARLLPGGALDTGFDASLPGGAANHGRQVLMQPDARILVATDAAGTGALRRIFSGQLGRAGVLEFSSPAYQANEGGGVQMEVRRVGGSLGALTVNYSTIPGSAGLDDFESVQGTLTWGNGDTTTKSFTIPVAEDGDPEPVEFFTVQLGVPTGGASLGETAVASVAVLDPGASNFARVRFTADSSHAFEFVTTPTVITVEMTPAQAEPVTVPFTTSGSATPGVLGDFQITPPASPLVFAPGETTKTFSITLAQDKITEIGGETVVLDLGFPLGTALLQAPFRHTFTIVDDDTAPDVSSSSNNQIVSAGQLAGPFEGNVSGSEPMVLEWQRNGKKLPGLTLPYHLIPAARVEDGGEYRLVASNKISKKIRGQPSHLVVVDTRVRNVVVPKGGKAVLLAEAGGNDIGFEWRKAEGGFPSARAGTRFDRKLTLSKLELEDSGTYICRVSNSLAVTSGGDLFMDAGPVVLKVVDTAPLIALLENELLDPSAIVGGTYTYPVPVDPETRKAPLKWSASGLPPGLKIDSVTGVISGRPTAPDKDGKPYDVVLTAANNGGKHSVKVRLSVAAMPPGVAGVYTARLERHAAINEGLGGRLDFAVSPTGALSGVLYLGGAAHKFAGALEVDVDGLRLPGVDRLRINLPGKPVAPPPLDISFSLEDNEVKEGVISNGAENLAFTGWRNVWSLAENRADALAGRHNLVMEMPSSIPEVPRGHGFGTAQVAASGIVTFTGMTADREKITGSALLGPDGRVVFHQALYKNKPQGSLNGEMIIERGDLEDDPADNRVTGSVSWLRPAIVKPRLYAEGFGPVDLQVHGGFYQAPALPLGMDGPGRVRLVFTEAGLPASREPGITLDVDARGKLIPPLKADNRAGTTLKITSASGLFSGKFSLEDGSPVPPPAIMKRSSTFQGIIVPEDDGLRGYGWFILQQLPSRLEGTTVKTSPFESGDVRFEQVPPP